MFAARIRDKPLADLCRRLATSEAAGIDDRKIWEREAASGGTGQLKARAAAVRDRITTGDSISEALSSQSDYFPKLFLELVHVGEQTGHLPDVLHSLADYYEHRVALKRQFLTGIFWPIIQLVLAVGVLSLVILVIGLLDLKIDILGFGLRGFSGMLTFLGIVALLVAAVGGVVFAMRRGVLWTRPIQRLFARLPGTGPVMEALALSRLTWTMRLTLNTSLDVKKALELSLGSTQNPRYTEHTDAITSHVVKGGELYPAFAATGVFPVEFLDSLQVGELSGQLPETMSRLSEQYRDLAKQRMTTLTRISAACVGIFVGLLLIFMIYQIASRTLMPYYREAEGLTSWL